MLGTERLFESLRDLIHAWKHRLEQRRMVRHRNVGDRDPVDWRIEEPERLLRDGRCDLGAETRREIVLMNDHAVARLFDGRQDATAIPWSD